MNLPQSPDVLGTMPRWFTPLVVILLVGLAALMGRPSLHGQYSSGDDIQLVRDNVLVNHPSLRHAVKLFLMPAHRDLYQPVALLSFQIDFFLGELLTFRGDPRVVHLHNILSHALNAVLVFLFLRQLTGRPVVAAVSGLLMAVHPMNVEAVAWVNGRMMLQSTTYFLLGLMAFEHWHRSEGGRRWGWLVAALGLFLWTMLSKVRVELPGILGLLLIYRRVWPTRRWWMGWLGATVISVAFSAWAVFTTSASEMFELAASEMRGPRLARAFQSVAWYFGHYVLPVGLGPWHPPDAEVSWLGGDIPQAVALVVIVLAGAAYTWRWGRTGVVGMLWFGGAIFSTLQIVATRAVTAGERYAYLPGIGLHWITAAALVWLGMRLAGWLGPKISIAVCGMVLVAVAAILTTVARHTCTYYRSSVTLAHRVIELYPNTPDVFVDLAWAYIREGEYAEGLRYARRQFDYPEPNECLIYQAIAWAQFKMDDYEAAEQSLLRARQAEPEYSKVYYRLGLVYSAQQRWAEAERMYSRSVELTPLYLPAAAELAHLYLEQGRLEEAEQQYKRILAEVNPYHPESRYNLGDIYMTWGRYDLARGQYERLLSYMPEHAEARVNLGLCLQRTGDLDAAKEIFDEALRRDPGMLAARLNRAALLVQIGRADEALSEYRHILGQTPAQRDSLGALSELLLSRGGHDEAAGLWRGALAVEPEAADLQAGLAWVLCRSPDYASAVAPAEEALHVDPSLSLAHLAVGISRYRAGDYAGAATLFETVARNRSPNPAGAYGRAMEALGRFSSATPDSPWPYYYTALLLAAEGRHDQAALGLREFRSRCRDAQWVERAERILSGMR